MCLLAQLIAPLFISNEIAYKLNAISTERGHLYNKVGA